jgi:HSP90 family molecular chaperone
MEVFLKNDVEVILLTDVVDGFWTNVIHDHAGKDLKSITRADVDLKDIEKSEKDNKNEDYTDEEKAMTDIFAKVLQGKVVAVKIATKLVDSPSCLSVAPGAMDSRMEDFLVAQNQLKKRSLKILEINPKNELVKRTYELLKNTINSNTVSSNTTNSNANSEHREVDLTNANKDGLELATMIYELAVIGQGDHLENAGSAVKRILKYIK